MARWGWRGGLVAAAGVAVAGVAVAGVAVAGVAVAWAAGPAVPVGAAAAAAAPPPPVTALASLVVAPAATGEAVAHDGVVEAVRQTTLAAQVPGAVVALAVKVGDRVKAGQVLLRLDARAADQQAGAAAAQVQAARAAQEAASRDFERQGQLFQKHYISQAALDRAEAQHKAAQAQAAAQLAAAGAAQTASGFYVLKAPYDAVVSEIPVVLGDMALPGRPLLTLYDPAALRVTAAVPQTAAPGADAQPQAELPGLAPRIAPQRWQLLPAVDPATHTVQLRLDLPAGTAAAPGQFARVWLPGSTRGATPRVVVPARVVVQRAELAGVYVLGADDRPLLRQVRLGPARDEQVEVLAGLAAGERVALDPQAAARVR